MLNNSPKLTVDLVVHVKGNASLAKARAIAVRNYIVTSVLGAALGKANGKAKMGKNVGLGKNNCSQHVATARNTKKGYFTAPGTKASKSHDSKAVGLGQSKNGFRGASSGNSGKGGGNGSNAGGNGKGGGNGGGKK